MSESREARWLWLALALWGAVLIGIAVRLLVDRPGHRSVFAIYYQAAERWRAGVDLYPERANDPALPSFRYSPPVAAALTPLSLGPLLLGEIAWRLLTGGALLAAMLMWARTVMPHLLSPGQVSVFLLLVLPLTASNWNNGQCNLLVLALLLAATSAAIGSRWNLAAACLAVAALFKIYPLAAGLLLAICYPRQLLPRLALALVLGLAFPFLVQEPSYVARQYALWFTYLLGEDRTAWDLQLGNTDFQLLVRVWIGPLDTRTYRLIEMIAGLGIALLCLAGRRTGWPERCLLTFMLGMSCIWMTAFGPASESATYALLAPTIAWAVLEARLGRSSRLRFGLVAASYLLLLSVQLSGWVPGLIRPYNKLGPQPFAALLLLSAMVLPLFPLPAPKAREA